MAAKMVRCPEGHFFDPSHHGECPWCSARLNAQAAAASDVTQILPSPFAPPLDPAPGFATAPPFQDQRTIVARAPALVPGTGRSEAVVGWLVCVEGPDRGRDYRLRAQKNYIGRSPHMDVCIAGDNSVSREKHGVVFFDPKKQIFWVVPGDSAGVVYLNGDILVAPAQLRRDDIIELGRTKLVLVPFCDGRFNWTTGEFPVPQSPLNV